MRRSRFSEEQMGEILREHEKGAATGAVYRRQATAGLSKQVVANKGGDLWETT